MVTVREVPCERKGLTNVRFSRFSTFLVSEAPRRRLPKHSCVTKVCDFRHWQWNSCHSDVGLFGIIFAWDAVHDQHSQAARRMISVFNHELDKDQIAIPSTWLRSIWIAFHSCSLLCRLYFSFQC